MFQILNLMSYLCIELYCGLQLRTGKDASFQVELGDLPELTARAL